MKIVAKALLYDGAGRILLLRRSLTHPNYPHHYDFPGGEVEDGETHHIANQREILEETSLVVPIGNVKLIYEKEISLDLTHIIHEIKLQEKQPAINLSWEHDGYIWLTLGEFLNSPVPEDPDDYYQTVLDYLHAM